MEIRVANESEKKLIAKFLDILQDHGIEMIQEDDCNYSTGITYEDYEFLRCNMPNITIDPSKFPMIMDSDCFYGTCADCKSDVEFPSCDGDISYEDYLYYRKISDDGKMFCCGCVDN